MRIALLSLRIFWALPVPMRRAAVPHIVLGAFVLIGLLSGTAQAQQAGTQERFALLIANLSYNKQSVGELQNPKHDIELIERALVRSGFPRENIVKRVDLNASGLRSVAQSYAERVRAAGPGAISFFYYSGHGASAPMGMPNAGMNYILPVDLDGIDRPDLWERAVKLDEISDILTKGATEALHIIIFDACRSELKLPARGGTKGFQAISFSEQSQYAQVLLAFSTSPNKVAYDSFKSSENGPYARALDQEIAKPGIDHLHLFANIRTTVMNMTSMWQIPWWQDGLLSPLVLLTRPAASPSPQGSAPEKCDVDPAQAKLDPIKWAEIPEKSFIHFKSHGYTYEQPRLTAEPIEEFEGGYAHEVKPGTKIEAGKQRDEIVWYRYQRKIGSARTRYVAADQADLQ
jgi:hypothetical protein